MVIFTDINDLEDINSISVVLISWREVVKDFVSHPNHSKMDWDNSCSTTG